MMYQLVLSLIKGYQMHSTGIITLSKQKIASKQVFPCDTKLKRICLLNTWESILRRKNVCFMQSRFVAVYTLCMYKYVLFVRINIVSVVCINIFCKSATHLY